MTKQRGLGWTDEKHLEIAPHALRAARDLLSSAAKAARSKRCRDALNALLDGTAFAANAIVNGMAVTSPQEKPFKDLGRRQQRVRAQVFKACVR